MRNKKTQMTRKEKILFVLKKNIYGVDFRRLQMQAIQT